MKKLIPSIAALLLLSSSPMAFAKEITELPADSRIKVLPYSPTDVYTVPTKYGYQTSIVFAASESVRTISVGDRSMWQIVPSGNRIFIRPMDDGLTTNMTVITNQREYNFDIKSVDAKANGNLYVIQFSYPGHKTNMDDGSGDMPDLAPPVAAVMPRHGDVAIPTLDTQRTQTKNDHYTYTGPDAIAPAQVYDDGKRTYITYNTIPSPTPRPFINSDDGKQVLAAYRTDGNTLVVNTVASGMVIKSAGGEIKIYNEQFQ